MRADRTPQVRSGDRRGSKLGERKFNGLLCDLEPCAARLPNANSVGADPLLAVPMSMYLFN
jgi:hypothetical protein